MSSDISIDTVLLLGNVPRPVCPLPTCMKSMREQKSKHSMTSPNVNIPQLHWVENGYQLLKTNWTERKSITNQENFLLNCPNELRLVDWPSTAGQIDNFRTFIWLSETCISSPETKKSSSRSHQMKSCKNITTIVVVSVGWHPFFIEFKCTNH